MRIAVWTSVVFLTAAALAPAVARADAAFDLGIGYAHLSLDGSDRFKERDGLRVEPRFSFTVSKDLPQLRLGVGLGLSTYTHELDSNTTIIVDNGNSMETFTSDQWEVLTLIEPEFQVSWRQPLGNDRRLFIEPGIGIGAAIANYGIYDGWWWDDDDVDEWDATFEVRPFIRAGYQTDAFTFGLEASYLFGGSIRLTDQVHGDLNEFYAGGFFGWRW